MSRPSMYLRITFFPMADLGHDQSGVLKSISDSPPSHYTIKIQSFSLLNKNNIEKYESSEFAAGGYKWKLALHPNGNKTKSIKDHISFYLVMVETNSLHPGWEVHAVFRFFLLNQNTDKYLIVEDSLGKPKRFRAMRLEWGFDTFIPLEAFNNSSNGYLVNDNCIFGAEVFICRERNSGQGEFLTMVKDAITYKHTWHISRFSSLTAACEDSSTFAAGDNKWKIQLYPKGKGRGLDTHISLYLALADPKALPPTCKIFVEFTLRILDQIQAKHDFGKATYWFSQSNPECGWPRFISISYFRTPSVGYLVMDGCTLEAEVTVHGVRNSL